LATPSTATQLNQTSEEIHWAGRKAPFTQEGAIQSHWIETGLGGLSESQFFVTFRVDSFSKE
jgi:hypothetical protein